MEVIASILGGLVGGLFTFLGVFITIRHDKAKEKKKRTTITITQARTGVERQATFRNY